MLRYIVLGLLRDGMPRHGYALMKAHRERSGVQIGTGNFYRELQRLTADGLVSTAVNPPDADDRRTPFQITARGAAVFDGWLHQPDGLGLRGRDDEFSCRALFVTHANPAGV